MSQPYQLEKLSNHTLKITLEVPWDEIASEKEKLITQAVATAQIKGFRLGKAPKSLVLPTLDQGELLSKAAGNLIPKAYTQAVNQLGIKPIMYPQIHLEKSQPDQAWVFHALTCEAPTVELNSFKPSLKGLFAKIVLPGDEAKSDISHDEKLTKLIDHLTTNINVDIPELLAEDEANRMLTKLLDQLQKLGLTVEGYLASKGKTATELKADYLKTATDSLKTEFILDAITKNEKTYITDSELSKWLEAADPDTQKLLSSPAQKSSLQSVLSRRKTLDFLLTLT